MKVAMRSVHAPRIAGPQPRGDAHGQGFDKKAEKTTAASGFSPAQATLAGTSFRDLRDVEDI
jgi:hypothetical protein